MFCQFSRWKRKRDKRLRGMCPPCLALRLVCTGVRTDGVVRIIIKIYAAANNIIPIFQVPKCAVRGSLNPNGSAHTFLSMLHLKPFREKWLAMILFAGAKIRKNRINKRYVATPLVPPPPYPRLNPVPFPTVPRRELRCYTSRTRRPLPPPTPRGGATGAASACRERG